MTTNLLIGHPDIPFNAIAINESLDFDADHPATNVISGARSAYGQLETAVSGVSEIEFDQGVGNTATADYAALIGAKLLKGQGVTRAIVRGSAYSVLAPSAIASLKLWMDPGKGVSVDSLNRVIQWADQSASGLFANYATDANKPIWTRADNKANWFTYSEQFDNSAWTKNQATISANAAIDPNEQIRADALVEDTNAGNHSLISGTYSVVSGVSYRFSGYLKKNTRSVIELFMDSAGFPGTPNARFDLNAGTVLASGGSASASIESIGDGWYRCTITAAATATGTARGQFYMHNGVSTSYTGDGASSLYVWGAQFNETTADATYLRTEAASEYQGLNGNPVLRFWDDKYLDFGVVPTSLQITGDITIIAVIRATNDQLAINHPIFAYETANTRGYQVRLTGGIVGSFPILYRTSQAGASTSLTGSANLTVNTTYVVTIKRATGTATHYTDGATNGSGAVSNPVVQTAPTTAYIGRDEGTGRFHGVIGDLLIFNTALSNADREAVEGYLATKYKAAAIATFDLDQSTFDGPQSEDLVSTFATSTAYRYWWLSLYAKSESKRPLRKIYIGTGFDLGRDPIYGRKVEGNYFQDKARNDVLRFAFDWPGITNAKRESFEELIGVHRAEFPVVLYHAGEDSTILGYSPIFAKINSYIFSPVENSKNDLSAEFEELI